MDNLSKIQIFLDGAHSFKNCAKNEDFFMLAIFSAALRPLLRRHRES